MNNPADNRRHAAADAPPVTLDDAGDPPVAAIDIGSNSIKMTIARLDPAGGLEQVAWASETVRLGAGVEATGRLADDRVAAALATLARFAAEARGRGAGRIVAVATEATRAAANGAEFLDHVRREIGIGVRVIDGDEEAALTFRGLAATNDVSGRLVVADIGGGSTEVIVAAGGRLVGARSLPLGSGRLTERHVAADPPTAAELVDCRRAAAAIFGTLEGRLPVPAGGDVRLLVVGGTGEYLGRLVPDEHRVSPRQVEAVLGRLTTVTADELARDLAISPARARVLPAGVAIVAALADVVRPGRIEIARSGVRVGLLLEAFARPSPPEPAATGA